MKKNYFMLAAAAMMFAACSQSDLVDEIQESAPQVIEFSTFANKTTRAEITDTTALQSSTEGFKVWGTKTYSGTPTTVFDGVKVYYSGGAWTYDNKKYWDETATYDFYAVAPCDTNSTISAGKITIKDVASGKSADSKDYLIDRNGNTGVAGSVKAIVPFDFNHTMAKLSFVLQAGVAEYITVTSLTMTGWDNALGKFVQTLNATPTTNSLEEWSMQTAKVAGSATLVGTGAGDASILLPNTKAGVNVKDTYIMVPQTIAANDLTFTINYTINGEDFTAQVGQVATAQTWGTDTHTTYTIIVAPNVINFDVNSVAGWTTKPEGSATIN